MSSPAQIAPSVFIGSSTEGLEIARAIEVNLQDAAEITLWSHGVFGPGSGYLESLVSALEKFDFAILVLTPDDVVLRKDDVTQAPRDNVMFELGLFMGRLGRNRTFAICSDDPRMRLPSDLAGVNLQRFKARQDGNEIAAVSPACTLIRKQVRELGISDTRVIKRLTAATTLFEGASNHVERLVFLLAQSRVLELEVISKLGMVPTDVATQLVNDLNRLKSETERTSLHSLAEYSK